MLRRRPSSDNDARILIANSLVDIDPDYAVSASDLPNRGTGGSGYDLDTNVGTAANRKIHPSGSCLLFGASGDYVTTPDTAGNSITGDIDIRARVAPDDWTPASENTAVAKWSSGQNSFTFGISSTSGRLVVNLSPVAAGTGAIQVLSSVGTGFTDGSLGWIRMTWSNSSDVMNFYSSTDDTDDDAAVNWTQLGTANVSAVLAGIADTTANVSIGAYNGGASSRFNGTIRKVAIYNGINGTLAVDFDPTNYVSGTTFSSGGVTWTLNGNSFIQNTGHDVLHSIGSNGLETAAGQTINSPGTVFLVGGISDASPAGSTFLFNARSDAGARWLLFTEDTASDRFSIFQGSTTITIDEATDANPHVFTMQFNGDSTSKLTVSGLGSKVGDAGSGSWDFGTIFASQTGGNTAQGYIARLLVFDYALSETQVSAIQNYLSSYYGGI